MVSSPAREVPPNALEDEGSDVPPQSVAPSSRVHTVQPLFSMAASWRRTVLLALTLTVQAAAASRMDPCGVDAAVAKVRCMYRLRVDFSRRVVSRVGRWLGRVRRGGPKP